MNTQANAMPGSRFGSWPGASALISMTRPFYWSVRRELWENRWIHLAPLGVASVFLLGYLISLAHLGGRLRALPTLDMAHGHEATATPYNIAAALMMAAAILMSIFYCADALHGERRDRSILFWKSLPVSDLTTVLAKASIPLLIVPLLVFAVIFVLTFIMLLLNSAVLLASGGKVAELWTQLSFFRTPPLLLYHLLTAHTLWPAPIYCWLILVSGWARRATFVWAALPVFAIAAVEKIAFNTWHFASLVGRRLIGDVPAIAASSPQDVFPTDPMVHITPARFFMSSGLWMGLAIAAVFLFAAVRLRRYQGPI
jgi:ABC-2 type transport system permease protein